MAKGYRVKEDEEGDLVTVLVMGEFVGRLDKNDDTGVHLDNPKMIVIAEGKMGFARGVCMTGEENHGAIFHWWCCHGHEVNPDINKAYTEIVSGLKL